MKISLYSREVKMLLHLISISIFSIPITTHVLRIALKSKFSIGQLEFAQSDSILVIILILLMISVNIISIMTDKFHKLSLLVTGIFFFAVTLIQLLVLNAEVPMNVLGHNWGPNASVFEAYMTGIFCTILFLYVYFLKDEKRDNIKTIFKKKVFISIVDVIENIKEKMKDLDRRLVFLLGIVCSLILAVPLCAILFVAAGSLVDDYLNIKEMKLLAWIGIVGMQGSVISMLLGLRRFDEKQKEIDKLELFLNALVRPFIGLSFAHLSFFMLESGLLQNGLAEELSNAPKETKEVAYTFNYHVCIAFIAGFTERIAKVIQPLSGEKKTIEANEEKNKPANKKVDTNTITEKTKTKETSEDNDIDGIVLL